MKEQNKIEINNVYSMSRDANGWTLYTKREGFHPKTKEPTTRIVQTYYGRLDHLCAAVIDRMAGDCGNMSEIRELLSEAASGLIKTTTN